MTIIKTDLCKSLHKMAQVTKPFSEDIYPKIYFITILNPYNMIELIQVLLDNEYKKKFHLLGLNDFCHIYNNGKKVSDTLYRIGGIGSLGLHGNNKDTKYSLLLKHTEDLYPDIITKNPLEKPYLKSQWCIVNEDGLEKIVAPQFEHLSIYDNVIIYSQYHFSESFFGNIETNEFYCKGNTCLESHEYLWIKNEYDTDISKRGIMRINKKTGTYKIYK